MNNFRENLIRYRKAKYPSAKKFAEVLGLPYNTYISYRNYVYDDEKKILREITEIEYLIVEYCIPHRNHLNAACAKLGHNNFEREPYHTKDLKAAGQAIYKHELNHKGRKNKIKKQLVERLPEYLNG